MNNRDAAELLRQVIPLIEDGKPMNGFIGVSDKDGLRAGYAWFSRMEDEKLSFEARSSAHIMDATHVRAVENRETVFPIDMSTFAGHPRNAATTRAAVRLAVSRLYDGPQDAPVQPVAISSKPALCTERGCSQDRTVGMLCASHAGRAEVYAREGMEERNARFSHSWTVRDAPAPADYAQAKAVETGEGWRIVAAGSLDAIQASGGGGGSSTVVVPLAVPPVDADPTLGTRTAVAKVIDGVLYVLPGGLAGHSFVVGDSEGKADADRLPCTTPKCRGHIDASAREHCQRRAGVK